jgi:hypothetical protein
MEFADPVSTIRNHEGRDGAPHRLWLRAFKRAAKALGEVKAELLAWTSTGMLSLKIRFHNPESRG